MERDHVSELHCIPSFNLLCECVTTFGAAMPLAAAVAPKIAFAVACAVGDFLPPSDGEGLSEGREKVEKERTSRLDNKIICPKKKRVTLVHILKTSYLHVCTMGEGKRGGGWEKK